MLLKTASHFLNEKIRAPPNEYLFADKPLNYPTNILSKNLNTELTEIISSSREENVQYFFDQALSNVCENMNKNFNFFGDLIMIQLIGQRYPAVCNQNLARNAMLRNSYQNQSHIGLTLLWGLGECLRFQLNM